MLSQLIHVLHIRHQDRRHEESNGNTQLCENEQLMQNRDSEADSSNTKLRITIVQVTVPAAPIRPTILFIYLF